MNTPTHGAKLACSLFLGLFLFGCAKRDSLDISGTWNVKALTITLPILEQWFSFSKEVTSYQTGEHTITTKLEGTISFDDPTAGNYVYDLTYTIDASVYGLVPLHFDKTHHDEGTFIRQGDHIALTSRPGVAVTPMLPSQLSFVLKTSRIREDSIAIEEPPGTPLRDPWFIRLSGIERK